MMAVLLMAGVASATPATAPEGPGTDATWIIDIDGFCNDVEIALSGSSQGGFYPVTGWEFGCGYQDRQVTGTARVADGIMYIQYFQQCTLSCTSYRICSYNMQLDMQGGMQGPMQMECVYDGYHALDGWAYWGPGTAQGAVDGIDAAAGP
jgi:hypothetical protein